MGKNDTDGFGRSDESLTVTVGPDIVSVIDEFLGWAHSGLVERQSGKSLVKNLRRLISVCKSLGIDPSFYEDELSKENGYDEIRKKAEAKRAEEKNNG